MRFEEKIVELRKQKGLSQEELAEKLSKSQSSIANKLRVLKLEDSVKKLLLEHRQTQSLTLAKRA